MQFHSIKAFAAASLAVLGLSVPSQAAETLTAVHFAPSLDTVAIPPNIVALEPVTLSLVVRNVKTGTLVQVLQPTAPTGACTFVYRVGAPLPSGSADADHKFAFALKGHFINAGADATGPCSLAVKLSRTDLDAKTAQLTQTFSTLRLTQPISHTVVNTKDLQTKLNFSLTESQGTCTGTSDGPAGKHTVGKMVQGGDIFFKIRSGPLGTECTWRSTALLLGPGVRLTAINFQPFIDERCAVILQHGSEQYGHGTKPLFVGAPFLFSTLSTSDPARSSDGTTAGTNPSGAGAPATVLGPIDIHLQCGTTLINDREVNTSIESLVFSGPPDAVWP